jgi:cellulose synthase/poly-beta-1,6-N-acetylglucosamine synthase-like glycosyltransferase
MFKFLIGLILLGAAFGGSFYAGKKQKEERAASHLAEQTTLLSPSLYPLENRSFVFVVQGYNNGAYVEKTIESVFSQKYEPYRVIYIDDASDDGSFELARDLIYAKGDLSRVTLVHNEMRLGALANLFRAVQACQNDEVVIPINGDDWLAHEWALVRLNQYYANPDVWLTCGQYREYPHYSTGQNRSVGRGSDPNRQYPFSPSQLKSFYAGLFKKISEQDFNYQGIFYPASCDLAYMLPMFEMAEGHTATVGDVHYIANRAIPYKEDREMSARCEKLIRSLTAYQPLPRLQEMGGSE